MEPTSLYTSFSDIGIALKNIEQDIDTIKITFLEKQQQGLTQNKDLYAALCKAQAEMPLAAKAADNPFFKSSYADLATIIKTSRPHLCKFGLAVIQKLNTNSDGILMLSTLLVHESGQSISSEVRINPAKNDVQSIGSYITYMRRYSYAAIIGICGDDEDDDGEATMVRVDQYSSKYNDGYTYDYITKEQIDVLNRELSGEDDIMNNLKNSLRIKDISEIKKSMFVSIMDRIKKIKISRHNAKNNIVD